MDTIFDFSFSNILVKFIFFAVFAYFVLIRPGLSLAPWVPTPVQARERVRRLAELKPGETFIEAGCGNARITLDIARHFPEVKVTGIEYSPLIFAWAKVSTWISRLPNVTIKYGDVLKIDMSTADVVYTYALSDTVNKKLLPKILKELKPGARFISYAFRIDEPSVQVDTSESSGKIYVYKKP